MYGCAILEELDYLCNLCNLIELQIFGFLNLILWAGNCWFIYKETPFHKDPNPPATMEEVEAPNPEH